MTERARHILGLAILVLLPVLAYFPAIRSTAYIWDDDDYLTQNPHVRDAAGLKSIWKVGETPQYYPLVFTTFWIEHHLWGLNPRGYHAVNVILHATSAALVWIILRRLRVPGAWVAAAVFAVHPLCVESVAWVTERKNVLSMTFALASLLTYLRVTDVLDDPDHVTEQNPRGSPLRASLYLLVIVFFSLSLLSKTVTASLPAVILVIWWWKRARIRPLEVALVVTMFVIGISFGLLTASMERTNVGAVGDEFNLTPAMRTIVAGRAAWFHAGKLLWPSPLIFVYPRWAIDPHLASQFLFPISAIAIVIAFWSLRRHIGRGALAGLLIYGGLLFPALGFVNVYPMRFSFVADHFAYLSAIPFIALVVATATTVTKRLKNARIAATAVAGLVVVSCMALTWRRTHAYANAETLWRDTIAQNPAAWLAHHNLGVELQKRGESAAALDSLLTACTLKPDDAELRQATGDLLLLALGRPADAIPHYLQAVKLDASDEAWAANDKPAQTMNNLGSAYLALGQDAVAAEQLREVVRRRPEFLDAWGNLATAEFRLGHADEAVRLLKHVIERKPDDALNRFSLGSIFASGGRLREGIAEYELGLRLKPDDVDAHVEVAQMLLNAGERKRAREHLIEALTRRPDHPGGVALWPAAAGDAPRPR